MRKVANGLRRGRKSDSLRMNLGRYRRRRPQKRRKSTGDMSQMFRWKSCRRILVIRPQRPLPSWALEWPC